MKKCFILVLILSGTFQLFAQQERRNENWHFGYHAGFNFNNGNPTFITSAYDGNVYQSSESFADMSDTSGRSLFYTNGREVFDKFDSIMPNGTGLAADNSSTQGSLIVPYPGNPNLYYIFTTDLQAGPSGFCYSMVDMSLNNGKGDVTTKNVKLLNRTPEKLCAVSSADGGFWVMTHDWLGDGYYAYKITSAGLNTTPVITHIGIVHEDDLTLNNTNGQMKFSPDGKKLAACISYEGTVDLFDFNNATGVLSNATSLTGTPECYGLEFSPDNSKLYVSHNSTVDYILSQYNLDLPTGNDILLSRTTVGSSGNQLRGLQLATNNKIYMARNSQNIYVGVINDPDSLGMKSNFDLQGFNLDPNETFGVWSEIGLPNLVKYINKPGVQANFLGIDTFICPGTCVNFTDGSINEPTSWRWNFQFASPDTSTQQNPQNICYPSSGNYTVILIVGNAGGFDTLRVNNAVKVYPVPSISITVLGDTLTVFSGLSWQWYRNGQAIPGATGQVYVADSAGNYSVAILDANGCTTTSSPIVIAGISEVEAAQVRIFPNPATGNNWQLTVGSGLIGSKAEVFDAAGRLVWKQTIQNQRTEIAPPGISTGIYMLRISAKGDSITRKLVRM